MGEGIEGESWCVIRETREMYHVSTAISFLTGQI